MNLPLQYITVGGSSRDESRRRVKWESWAQVQALCVPWAGGWFLRAAAGLSADSNKTDIGDKYNGERLRVEVDTAREARRDGMGWLADGFAEAWGPWMKKAGAGKRLIAYVGAVPSEMDHLPVEKVWHELYDPYTRVPGVELGVDCAAALKRDSKTRRTLDYGRSLGTKVLVESQEVLAQSHWLHAGGQIGSRARRGYSVISDHNRIEHAYGHPDGWMLARDIRGAGGEPLLGIVVDDKEDRMKRARTWRHPDRGGWTVAMYLHDVAEGEWAGE